jgi:GNAT superfamily N-acetyltransferase
MNITLATLTAADIARHQEDLIDLLRDAVESGASVNFLLPFPAAEAAAYWSKVAAEVAGGERVVIVALEAAGRVVGCAHLALAGQPNGAHRAEVQKVLVHRRARRQGIARRLMQQVEQAARAAGRTLLVLDTETGSPAEALYTQMGYTRAGSIPDFAIRNDGGGLLATTLFYRRLS